MASLSVWWVLLMSSASWTIHIMLRDAMIAVRDVLCGITDECGFTSSLPLQLCRRSFDSVEKLRKHEA
eukprot:21094-Eustigmatos_ZCMA.PRE.1